LPKRKLYSQTGSQMNDMNTGMPELNFDNSYARLPEHFYHRVAPQPLQDVSLVSFNPSVARILGLEGGQISADVMAKFSSGQLGFTGSEPLAMKYAGHQFGVYNPDLGDGRGLLLGEVVTSENERWDIHLKGAGTTRYSRFGDGRAVLRSSIREYLASAAMAGLNIPTTRALALAHSQDQVMRDGMMEPCAGLLRVTRCHIRFGHFEHFFYQNMHDDLKVLADYSIERYFPACADQPNPYVAMLREVVTLTASLIARWQAYGFVHGVMNSDNMSLIGETFDYGPYSFMDNFRSDYVSNHSDDRGRYAFANQPNIGLWNLACLAQALLPLAEREELEAELERYRSLFPAYEHQILAQRLGLRERIDSDVELIADLRKLMFGQQLDGNRFFREINTFAGGVEQRQSISEMACNQNALMQWLERYEERLNHEVLTADQRRDQMDAVNPRYVLRNYMAEEVIQAATDGDYEPVNQLLAVLSNPFADWSEHQRWAELPPDWASGICLTCSS